MHAFCCNDTLPVKTATYILHNVCIMLLSFMLDISGSVRGAFGVHSGCVRGAFGVRLHNCITRACIFSTFRVTLQVYLRCPGSVYRCIYDVSGHFTGVFTMSRVTLQVYSRYPGSLYRCIYDVLDHFTGVFTMSRVTLLVYLRCLGSPQQNFAFFAYVVFEFWQCLFDAVIYFYSPTPNIVICK